MGQRVNNTMVLDRVRCLIVLVSVTVASSHLHHRSLDSAWSPSGNVRHHHDGSRFPRLDSILNIMDKGELSHKTGGSTRNRHDLIGKDFVDTSDLLIRRGNENTKHHSHDRNNERLKEDEYDDEEHDYSDEQYDDDDEEEEEEIDEDGENEGDDWDLDNEDADHEKNEFGDKLDEEDNEEEEDDEDELVQNIQGHDNSQVQSYSDWKWKHLGSRQGIDALRQSMATHSRTAEDKYETARHYVKVHTEGSCKTPRPKVVKVLELYPHSSKTYIPRCTILHQCGDDTGCCKLETQSCSVKYAQRVELYFYAQYHLHDAKHSNVEKLTFVNHTECECQDTSQQLMPRDVEAKNLSFRPTSRIGHFPFPKHTTSYKHHSRRNCRCPLEFSVRRKKDGACYCDCLYNKHMCTSLKKGYEYFSHEDRLCIQSEECLLPTCEYGSYIKKYGRCPKRKEKFDMWHKYASHRSDYV